MRAVELLGHWTFAPGSLSRLPDGRMSAADLTGNGADAVLDASAEAVPGRFGGALRLRRENGAVIQPGPDLMMFPTPGFALAFFLNVERQPEGDEWHTVLYRPIGGRKDARGLGVWLRGRVPGGQEGRLRAQTFSDQEPEYVDTHALPVGTWVHVAVVADVKWLRIWVDAGLHDEVPLRRPLLPVFGPIHLGRGRDEDGGFHGLIEDLRIYGGPLPEAEIRTLAAA